MAAFEECVSRGANQRVDRPAPARNGHVVIEAKRKPEAVEPRSEVGRARRDSDGDLLHDGLIRRLSARRNCNRPGLTGKRRTQNQPDKRFTYWERVLLSFLRS